MAHAWDEQWQWTQEEWQRWWSWWWQHGGWWHDDGYRPDWANTQFIGPRRADEDEDPVQRQYFNETLDQWEVASSNWSAPADEPDRFAFDDRALRSRNAVIADADEAGEADDRWEDPDDADRWEADEHRRESLHAVAAVAAEIYEARAAVPEEGNETASSRGSWTTEPSRDAAESESSLGS